jgi:hypothetical protein
VLATHGRGVWILDDISSLQQLTPQVLSEPAHLFAPRPVEEIRYFNPKAHQGDMVFHGDNPPAGALVDYYLQGDLAASAALNILDAAGNQVTMLNPSRAAGLNRVIWNLRHAALPPVPPDEEAGGRTIAIPGPFVMPGEYTVRLTAGGQTYDQKLLVLEDPRIQISAADRKAWTDALIAIGETYRGAVSALDDVRARGRAGSNDGRDVLRELQSRLATLYRAMAQSTAKPTADQQSQIQFFETELRSLRARVAR